MDREVIVKGIGQAKSLPDRAEVKVVIDGEDVTRDTAYNRAVESAKAVDVVIADYRDVLDRVTTTALSVHPKNRWKKGESIRTGWRASRTTVLEVVTLERLGDLIANLAGAGGAVTGPTWSLDPDNGAYSEARRLAAIDAHHRAEDYAQSLGLTIGKVAWIAEPGLRSPRPTDADWMGGMIGEARGESATDEDIIDISPEEIFVTATVEVAMEIVAD